MMTSPESYYENFLKGKTEAEIESRIRALKNEIGRLKNIMEHPEYGSTFVCDPSEDVQIQCNRLYLEKAKETLAEIGADYNPSKAEMKAEHFNENLFHTKRIEFTFGGIFGGYHTYIVDLNEERIKASHTTVFSNESVPHLIGENNEPYMTQYFLCLLYELHIGEWRNYYSLKRFGYVTLDGIEWNLTFYFDNDSKPLKFSGHNSYPYNFDKFCEILGVEFEC